MMLRRTAVAAMTLLALCPFGTFAAQAPGEIVWTFDRLDNIGGHKTTVEGHPRVVDTPLGKALEFDGAAAHVGCGADFLDLMQEVEEEEELED